MTDDQNTALSDFDAGIDRDDPNPEDKINRKLSRWLRGDNRTIYWNRNKTYGNGTFSVSKQSRPDLVIESKKRTYAVEVKPAEDSGTIHDGALQAFSYWRDIVDGEAEYTTGGKHLDIDAVLLATEYAPQGRLFHDWKNKDPKRSERSEGAKRAVQAGEIPGIEHTASETAIRLLYQFAKDYENEAMVGIGGLFSSALDGDNPRPEDAAPAALFYTPGWSSLEDERVQNWEYIPWYLINE